MAAEPIVRVAGASPALQHYQNPYSNGGTTYEVYRYVTWYDSPQDGTGAGDAADGNSNGVSDANGHDAKRVTVVVVWTNIVTGQSSSLSESSLFSDGQIAYKAPTRERGTDRRPARRARSAATRSRSPRWRPTRTARSRACRGTSATARPGSGASITHTYAAFGTYTVVNTVVDNGGSTANNSASSCHVTTTNPTAGNGGPDGTVVINGNAAYTNSTTVTLTLAKSGGGPNPATMKFSNDNSTWLGPFAWATIVHVDDPQRRRDEDRLCALLQLQRTVRRDRERHDHAGHDRARAPRPRSTRSARSISGANTTVVPRVDRPGRRHRPRRATGCTSA